MRPDLVARFVVSPPLPGAAKRTLYLKEAKEFWYTTLHQQEVAVQLWTKEEEKGLVLVDAGVDPETLILELMNRKAPKEDGTDGH